MEREIIYNDVISVYAEDVSEPKKLCSQIQDYAEDYHDRELLKITNSFIGDNFNDNFKFKATDGNGGVIVGTMKGMTFKHVSMYLQQQYHSVLSLEVVS